MRVYMYQAALHCEDCGEKIVAELRAAGHKQDLARPETYDSDDFPKGPEEEGESDSPSHCDSCGCFLESDLTSDGWEGLYGMITDAINEGRCSDAMREWIDFYDVSLANVLDFACGKRPWEQV